MSLSAIIASLETACASMNGVVTVKIPATERALVADELPAIVSDPIEFTISPAQLSVWDYAIPLAYLHEERGTNSEAQLNAIMDMPKALVDRLNANSTLGGKVYGMDFDQPSGEFGVIGWRDKNYAGFTLRLLLKEKYSTTFAG